MANNGDLGGIVVAKSGVPTDEQREQIIMDLRAKRAAQIRGEMRYAFLTGDIEVEVFRRSLRWMRRSFRSGWSRVMRSRRRSGCRCPCSR